MRLRAIIAVAAVSMTALVGGSIAAFGEHGHGFNCTPGNPANAENHHEMNGMEDQGNGDDCQTAQSVATTTPPTTTMQQPVPVTPQVTPNMPAPQPQAVVQGQTTVRAPAAVRAQPRTTG